MSKMRLKTRISNTLSWIRRRPRLTVITSITKARILVRRNSKASTTIKSLEMNKKHPMTCVITTRKAMQRSKISSREIRTQNRTLVSQILGNHPKREMTSPISMALTRLTTSSTKKLPKGLSKKRNIVRSTLLRMLLTTEESNLQILTSVLRQTKVTTIRWMQITLILMSIKRMLISTSRSSLKILRETLDGRTTLTYTTVVWVTILTLPSTICPAE